MLGETERIKPLLYSMANSTTASERYQASLVLAKTVSSFPPSDIDVPKRIDLKMKILDERTQALKTATRNFCQVGVRVLSELNTTDEQVIAVRDLAYYNLALLAESRNVPIDIQKI